MKEILLDFMGPYTFTEGPASLFTFPNANDAGIYLWTILQEENHHLIHYVGETTCFGKRHREHLTNILGLNYGIYSPEKAKVGILEPLFPGLWREKGVHGPSLQIKAYEKLNKIVLHYLSSINIFVAKLDVVSKIRKHIEGCIAHNFRNSEGKSSALYPVDNRTGRCSEKIDGVLLIKSPEVIKGLGKCIYL